MGAKTQPINPGNEMMKHIIYALLLLSFVGTVHTSQAQETDWRVFVEQMAEEEEPRSGAIENIYQELLYLENNPMNLNSVSRDQLERFPLLSLDEINSVMDFLEKNRPLYTVYELRNVPRLDYRTVALILPFFQVGETVRVQEDASTLNILKTGRHEVQVRFDKTVTPRAGYGEFTDSILERYPNRMYRGEDFYNSIRYSFRYRDKVQMGFTAEKDAGEPFLKAGHPKGYDHYGIHLIVRDMGKLKTVVLGDYRLSFGQGLVLNNDFVGSKAWSTGNVSRRTGQPKRHFSTAESGFFRGGTAVTEMGNFSLTAFYSNQRIDANLNDHGEITSFKVDGLHRTPLEIEKRKNTREQVTGVNINYREGRFQVGLSTVYHWYDRIHNPTLREYNRYYLRDSVNINTGIDYSYQLPGFIFAGETAIAKNGAVATLNMLQYRSSRSLNLSVLHRYYPVSYNALHAQAFSEGSRVQNEHGLYIGAEFQPFQRVSVSSYIDFIRFPWLKYGIDAPSDAVDIYLLGTYTFSRGKFVEMRYKHKLKEKNQDGSDPEERSVLPYATSKLRLRYSHEQSSGWSFRTTADMARYSEERPPSAEHHKTEFGYMLSQSVSYRGKEPLTGDAYLAWFDADTYNARLYSYERNLLSTFHMPSFYGKGLRLALSSKYQITRGIAFSVKAGYTRYFNRDTIGSGTEQIDGNSRLDLFTYLVWKF